MEALSRQSYADRFEVIVADNGSTDGTRSVVEKWSSRLTIGLVDASERPGANVARNAGASAAEGALLLFCDADDVVSRDWIAAMANAAPHCEGLGGRLDLERLNDPLTQQWALIDVSERLPISGGFLPYAMTANCGFRRGVFEELGGFNENYKHGSDDVEFCWRLQLASLRLCFVPDAVVHYRLRAALRPLARQYYEYGLAKPTLFREFRAAGMPARGLRTGLRAWRDLAGSAPGLLRRPEGRGAWISSAAFRAGLFIGSVRARVVYL